MTVRLRQHHLLCLLTYVGRGYSKAFTDNMSAIAERLAAGEEIEVVAGPDDICAPLLHDPDPHCLRCSVTERDRKAADDICGLLNLSARPGTRLMLDRKLLEKLRAAFSAGRIRSACAGCEWNELCGSIAAGGFERTYLATQ